MPTLVLKLVFVIIPTQAPFFVRPLVQMITSRVQHTFIDPDLSRKIQFVRDSLSKKDASGRVWFAGGDKDGNPTSADYQMLFPMEAITSGRMPAAMAIPESIKAWVDWVHSRPAYKRAYEKGGAYDYAKL